ncbi:MAG TPA: hypothetical protein VIC56_10635 [Gemmatimonadota bacterium]
MAAALIAVLGVHALRVGREAERLRLELAAAERAAAESLAVGGRPDGGPAGGSGAAPAPGAGPWAAGHPAGLLANEVHLRRLREAGLEDPLGDVRADLQAHPELIPVPSRLGGRMGFYSPDDIVLLNDRWVHAYFEDGHTAGSMLLEFDVREGGEIVWRPLASATW